MKNVTISMDDIDLAWAKAQAGKEGVSVSRWIAGRVARERQRPSDFHAQMLAVMETPLAPMSDGGRTFNREEIYDRRFMKRFR